MDPRSQRPPEGAPANTRNRLRRYRDQWEANARLDALWAVLTLDAKLGGGWDETAFFQTGEQEIEEVFRFARDSRIALPLLELVLDFGCGVGRLTKPLALRSRQVVGVDVSDEMIRRARGYFPDLTFHNTGSNDLEDLRSSSFDLIYTNIVLQHLARDLQEHYIREFSRLLRPSGLAIFQIPARQPAGSRIAKTLRMVSSLKVAGVARLAGSAIKRRYLPWRARMELHVLSKAHVVALATACAMRLEGIGNVNWRVFYAEGHFRLEPETNELEGQTEFPLSHLYFFRKQAP
jgi:2-polyprenyl-3-methyl-5-hydroxy-6-metoxy-1,4-benzoquinol methylase